MSLFWRGRSRLLFFQLYWKHVFYCDCIVLTVQSVCSALNDAKWRVPHWIAGLCRGFAMAGAALFVLMSRGQGCMKWRPTLASCRSLKCHSSVCVCVYVYVYVCVCVCVCVCERGSWPSKHAEDVISPFALTAHSEGLSMRGGYLAVSCSLVFFSLAPCL